MKYQIIGIRKVDYTSKKTGRQVHGVELYVAYERNGVSGVCAEKLYIPDSVLIRSNYNPTVGDHISMSYEKYGQTFQISGVALIE